VEIRRLDLECDDEARAWHDALREAQSAGLVAPLVSTRAAILTSLRTNDSNPNTDRRGFGAWQGTECVGAAILGLPRRGNGHLADIQLGVPPRARKRGVGRDMFDYLHDVARQEGRSVLATAVDVAGGGSPLTASPGGRFALARGFTPKHSELRLLLEVPAGAQELAALEQEAARRAGQYRLDGWAGLPPHEVLDQLARLHTMMDHDVPAGELSRKPAAWDAERVQHTMERHREQGYLTLTTLISDQGAQPAGYTIMLVVDSTGPDVVQEHTFVLRARRGNGYATLLKIANLRLLAEQAPQARRVHTWTAEVNDAMRTVNERVGFRPVETMYELEAPC
jgi:GNAT superfamily N-acetyltransferase